MLHRPVRFAIGQVHQSRLVRAFQRGERRGEIDRACRASFDGLLARLVERDTHIARGLAALLVPATATDSQGDEFGLAQERLDLRLAQDGLLGAHGDVDRDGQSRVPVDRPHDLFATR